MFGLAAPLIVAFGVLRKNGIDNAKSIAEAATDLIEPMHREIKDLRVELADIRQRYVMLQKDYQLISESQRVIRCEVDTRDRRISVLEAGVQLLTKQVEAMNQVPSFKLGTDKPSEEIT